MTITGIFTLRILWTRGENVAKIFAFWGLFMESLFLPRIYHLAKYLHSPKDRPKV